MAKAEDLSIMSSALPYQFSDVQSGSSSTGLNKQLISGHTYLLIGDIPTAVNIDSLAETLRGHPPMTGKRHSKIWISQVTWGPPQARRYNFDKRDISIKFTVLENPLPAVAAIALILGAATALALSGALVIHEIREVAENVPAIAKGVGDAAKISAFTIPLVLGGAAVAIYALRGK